MTTSAHTLRRTSNLIPQSVRRMVDTGRAHSPQSGSSTNLVTLYQYRTLESGRRSFSRSTSVTAAASDLTIFLTVTVS